MITGYEVVRVNDDGSGYMVVFTDAGESFGQNFTNAPVYDEAVFSEHIEHIAAEAYDRMFKRPEEPIAAVKQLVGRVKEIQIPPRGAK